MRKLLILFLLFSPELFAQSTTVSGTITDAGGQTWNGGTFVFTFVPGNNPPPFNWSGGTLQTTISGALNGSGAYSVSIPSNTAITPGGSSWTVSFCPQATWPCFTTGLFTVQGATMTMAPTPPAIAISLINPNPGLMRAYSDAEIASAIVASQYYNLLTQTVRICTTVSGQLCTAWVTSAGGSGIAPPAGDIGGSTLTPTVVSTHLTAPLPIAQGGTGTATPSLIAGTNTTITGLWPNQTINSTGGGGGGVTSLNSLTGALNIVAGANITVTPIGSNITISSSGAGALPNPVISADLIAAAPWELNLDVMNCGPTPWIDIRCFGARFIYPNSNQLADGGVTASIASGATTAVVTATTIQNGDNIFFGGAGLPNSMSTPAAPTVVASVSSGPTGSGNAVAAVNGATTYAYKVRAFDKLGGYTATSSATTITNGAATLGSNTIAVSTETFSGRTLTITTSARSPEIFVPTEMITIAGSPGYNGQVSIETVPNNTTITVTIGNSTVNGQNPASVSGGTIYYFNENYITPPTASGTIFGYGIYGPTCGVTTCNLMFVTKPISTVASLDGGYAVVEDYGTTMSGNPDVPVWLPSTDTAPASNDGLSVRINTGGGTTNVSWTSPAAGSGAHFCGTGTCSAAMTLLDNTPALIAAATNSAFPGAGGMVYIPSTPFNASFPFQTYADLSASPISNQIAVAQAGSIYLNGTINIGGVNWFGVGGYATDVFGFTKGQIVLIRHAYPGFFVDSTQTINLSGVQINNPANNYISLLVNNTGNLPTGTVQNTGFGNPSPTDYMGIPIVLWGGPTAGSTGIFFRDFSISTGPNQVNGSTATPLFMNNYFGEFKMENYLWNRRGYFEKVGGSSGNAMVADGNFEREGGITPMFTFMPVVNGGGFTAKISNQIQDTETVELVSNLEGIFNIALLADIYLDSFGATTGFPFQHLTVSGFNGIFFHGQNVNMVRTDEGVANDGVVGINGHISKLVNNQLLGEGAAYSAFADINPPTAPTASAASAGGTLTSNTYTFQIAPVFDEASIIGEGTFSFASNAITTSGTCPASGNCTIQFTYPAVLGAISHNAYLSGTGLNQCFIGNFTTTTVTVSAPATCNTPPNFSGGGVSGFNVHGLWAPLLNLSPRSAPGSPSNGDLWTTSTGAFAQIAGSTVGPFTQTIASGTAALGTALISNATCATVVTVSATGVLSTDNIAADFNGDPTGITGYNPATGMLTIIKWPSSGNVNFKVCNITGSSQTPGAVTLNWRVTR